MRIEILRQVMISGEPVTAGSFIEVSDADGNLLIGSGKAVAAPAVDKPAPVVVVEEIAPEPVKAVRKARTTPTKED